MSHVAKQPLPGGRRLERPTPTTAPSGWPLWGVPTTPAERSAAAFTVVRRLGLDRPGVRTWRLRAGLAGWFAAGWCPAALLWAIDHHPDDPGRHRGDAVRGAGDPIRVVLARLAPWSGRVEQLPAHLHGRPGDYRARQAERLAARIAAAESAAQPASSHSSAAHRARLRAQFAVHRRERSRR